MFNFGQISFHNRLDCICPINEPECLYQNFYGTAFNILDCLKKFVVEYFNYPKVALDDKLMIASLLWEYMIPLTHDEYVMMELMVSFFYELMIIPNPNFFELIVKTIDIHFSPDQLLVYMSKLFHFLS